MKPFSIFLACAALQPALAAEPPLARCRAVVEPTLRLACYDALASDAAAPPVPVSVDIFGFEHRVAEQAPESIASRIPGLFEGWTPNQRIRLENGQLWQVSDDSRSVMSLRDPKVRITRGAMGTFVLEIEGRRAAPRVRRVE